VRARSGNPQKTETGGGSLLTVIGSKSTSDSVRTSRSWHSSSAGGTSNLSVGPTWKVRSAHETTASSVLAVNLTTLSWIKRDAVSEPCCFDLSIGQGPLSKIRTVSTIVEAEKELKRRRQVAQGNGRQELSPISVTCVVSETKGHHIPYICCSENEIPVIFSLPFGA
jgi:hypothetical protein